MNIYFTINQSINYDHLINTSLHHEFTLLKLKPYIMRLPQKSLNFIFFHVLFLPFLHIFLNQISIDIFLVFNKHFECIRVILNIFLIEPIKKFLLLYLAFKHKEKINNACIIYGIPKVSALYSIEFMVRVLMMSSYFSIIKTLITQIIILANSALPPFTYNLPLLAHPACYTRTFLDGRLFDRHFEVGRGVGYVGFVQEFRLEGIIVVVTCIDDFNIEDEIMFSLLQIIYLMVIFELH